MKQPTNPHRPDVKPGRGFRILADGEAVQAGDEVQTLKSRRPFKLHWIPVELGQWANGSPIGRKVDCNWSAIRTKRPL